MQGGGYSDSIVGNWMQRSSASAKASQAAGTPVVISGGRSRSTQTQDSSSTEAVGSSLTAGRHLSIRATEGSIEAKDAQISAEGDALLYASDDIRLLAAADSRRQTGSSKRSGFSIDNRDHITPFGTFNDQGQAAGEIGSISGSTLSVGGKTRLLAEKGNIAVSGSSLVSQDDLLLKAGGDIDIRAAEHRQSQSERQVSSGIGSAVISDTEHFSGWMKNRRENEGEETRQAASQIGSLKAGGDINIRSREGDITVQGSNITAGDTIRLDSARDILLQSAQDSQHQDGKNRNAGVQVGVGVSVGAQTGVYIYAEAAYGKGKNRSDSQTHQNTLLQSDKLQLSSKGNTVLNGAQAHAKRIDAEVGGTLHIESPQDTVEQESKQSGGGIRAQVALGTAWSVSGNYNQSKASGHSRSVGSQSGLFAGEGGYHITADSVRLKGGAIASAADKDHNELTARSFSFEDIRNESSYSASSMGIGAGYGGSLKGSGGFNQSAFGRASQTAGQNIKQGLNYSPTLPQHESGGSQGYTRSVLSEGNITIGDQATSARALGIQTDLQNAHRSAEAVPDLQNLLDKQQTVAQSTAVIHSAVATYSGNRAKAAAEELEKQQAAYEGRLKEQNDGSYEQYAGKSDSERLSMRLGNAKYAQAYQEARSWGVGGSKSRALSAAETLITGALGGQGDLQLAANTLAPYAAAAIGKRFGHGENKNEAAQAIGHFMLGAALAYANGADPLAGGSAAVAAERAAEYLAKQYDDGKTAIDPISGKFNPNLLPEHIKEEIKAQTGALASVVGAAGGSLNGTNSSNGALFDAQVAGTVGQNAVENNYLSKEETIEFERRLEQCAIGDKKCLDETFADARMRSAKNRNDLILQCQRGGDQDPACAAKKVEIREGLQYVTSEEYAPLYASRQYPPRRKWAQLEPVTQTDSISPNQAGDDAKNLPVVTVLPDWIGKEGYSSRHFIIWENMTDIAYLESDRQKAADITHYLDGISFNHTNQRKSLLRPSDFWYTLRGAFSVGKSPRLGNLPQQVADGQQPDKPFTERAVEKVFSAPFDIRVADRILIDTGEGIIGLGEGLWNGGKYVIQNPDRVWNKLEQLATNQEERDKVIDSAGTAIRHEWSLFKRHSSNFGHAVANGNLGDAVDDMETATANVGGFIVPGKAAKHGGEIISKGVRYVGGNLVGESGRFARKVADNGKQELQKIKEGFDNFCHGAQCGLATPEGIGLPHRVQPESPSLPMESRAHGKGGTKSGATGKGSTSAKGSGQPESSPPKGGTAGEKFDKAVGNVAEKVGQGNAVYDQTFGKQGGIGRLEENVHNKQPPARNNRLNTNNSKLQNSTQTISSDTIIKDGSHFDQKGKLKPNVTYQAGEFEYIYQTDHLGRLKTWEAQELQLTKRSDRLHHNPNTPGKLSGDHAGHLAGDRFGGSPKLDNLVSQLSGVNLSNYKILENEWANALMEKKRVTVNVDIQYKGNSLRPDHFVIQYEIDGIKKVEKIYNTGK
ncbi:hemagglutinin repeat-containing protein [Neisseria sp. P0001.S003]|uniref:hemagglutinin repeat-containing protein n=2 Tax=unclassified Neisseria TaxID=2623750 RepID=UPI003F81EAB7